MHGDRFKSLPAAESNTSVEQVRFARSSLPQVPDWLASLRKSLEKIPCTHQKKSEIKDLNQEINPELFLEGALLLAKSFQEEGKIKESAEVLTSILRELPQKETGSIGALRARAQVQYAELSGRGDFSARFENILGRFVQEASDYRTIAPMLAGQAIYGLSKMTWLGRLTSAGSQRWYQNGLFAKTLAVSGAFGAEVAAFTVLSRQLRSEGVQLSLSSDLVRSSITLGALKLAGAIGARAIQASSQSNWSQGSQTLHHAQTLIPVGTSLLGLAAAHRIEAGLGFRSSEEGGFSELLTNFLALSIGANLGQRLLGGRLLRTLNELEQRVDQVNFRKNMSNFSSEFSSVSLPSVVQGRGRLSNIKVSFEMASLAKPKNIMMNQMLGYQDPRPPSEPNSNSEVIAQRNLAETMTHFGMHGEELLPNLNPYHLYIVPFLARRYQETGVWPLGVKQIGKYKVFRGLTSALNHRILSQDQINSELDFTFKKGAIVSFSPNDHLASYTSPSAKGSNGSIQLHFNRDGSPRYGLKMADHHSEYGMLFGFPLEKNSLFYFHQNGKLRMLTLGEDYSVEGKTYAAGTSLELDISGRVIASSADPVASRNNQDPYRVFVSWSYGEYMDSITNLTGSRDPKLRWLRQGTFAELYPDGNLHRGISSSINLNTFENFYFDHMTETEFHPNGQPKKYTQFWEKETIQGRTFLRGDVIELDDQGNLKIGSISL